MIILLLHTLTTYSFNFSFLFVSTASSDMYSQGLIQQCGLDGKGCVPIVSSWIQRPLSLAVDHKHSK